VVGFARGGHHSIPALWSPAPSNLKAERKWVRGALWVFGVPRGCGIGIGSAPEIPNSWQPASVMRIIARMPRACTWCGQERGSGRGRGNLSTFLLGVRIVSKTLSIFT
jgi:hypothetical protein